VGVRAAIGRYWPLLVTSLVALLIGLGIVEIMSPLLELNLRATRRTQRAVRFLILLRDNPDTVVSSAYAVSVGALILFGCLLKRAHDRGRGSPS
jgi:hypothetical protein